MRLAHRGRAVLIAVTALGCASACTSSGSPGGGSSAPPSHVSTSVAAPTLPTPSTTAAPPTTPVPTSTPASSPPVRTSSAAPQERSTCTNVAVRVIRGGADLGRELVALQFTNGATKSCVLVGYPAATLLHDGNQVGTPAQPTRAGAPSRMTLRPGDTAESRLTATTTCQAPLSDQVKVVVPGSTTTVLRPAQLRACILRVTPLGPPE